MTRPRTTDRDDTVVVAPQGSFDEDGLDRLDDVLGRDTASAVVIDLTECLLSHRSVLEALDPTRWGRDANQICVVCNRGTGRRLLHRTGVDDRMAVFGRTEDALQARVLAASGHGAGWSSDRR